MPTFLITVQAVKRYRRGPLQIMPGVGIGEFRARPTLGQIREGSLLEIRQPDGTTFQTSLVSFSITVFEGGDEDDCPIFGNSDVNLFVSSNLSCWDLPVGTEVWLLDD